MISLIIPAYNCEAYLDECLESVVKQTYRNLEILIVDDGSNEATASLCDKWELKDARIRVIHKENGGVSSARNVGIKASSGSYLAFLDADDALELNILEKAIKAHVDNMLSYWGHQILGREYDDALNVTVSSLYREDLIANAIYTLKRNYNIGTYFRASWGKLFETSILKENQIFFPEDIYIGEDAIFLLKYLQYVEGMNVVEKDGYKYRISNTSAVRRYKNDIYVQSCKQLDFIQKLINETKFEEFQCIKEALANFKWWMFTSVFENSKTGIIQKKLSLLSLFHEPLKWLKEHETLMRDSDVDLDKIHKKYQKLYKGYKYMSPCFLCAYYFFLRFIDKII